MGDDGGGGVALFELCEDSRRFMVQVSDCLCKRPLIFYKKHFFVWIYSNFEGTRPWREKMMRHHAMEGGDNFGT